MLLVGVVRHAIPDYVGCAGPSKCANPDQLRQVASGCLTIHPMGAWGVGSFANDSAADWLSILSDAIPTTLSLTFRSVIGIEPDLFLEEPDASEGIAAAEVVAAMRGQPGSAVTPSVVEWVATHSDWLTPSLVQEAIATVERVQSSSELRDLWSESTHFDAWLAELDDLLVRLRY